MSYETSVVANFSHSKIFWKVLAFLFVLLHRVSRAPKLNIGDLVRFDASADGT